MIWVWILVIFIGLVMTWWAIGGVDQMINRARYLRAQRRVRRQLAEYWRTHPYGPIPEWKPIPGPDRD